MTLTIKAQLVNVCHVGWTTLSYGIEVDGTLGNGMRLLIPLKRPVDVATHAALLAKLYATYPSTHHDDITQGQIPPAQAVRVAP